MAVVHTTPVKDMTMVHTTPAKQPIVIVCTTPISALAIVQKQTGTQRTETLLKVSHKAGNSWEIHTKKKHNSC